MSRVLLTYIKLLIHGNQVVKAVLQIDSISTHTKALIFDYILVVGHLGLLSLFNIGWMVTLQFQI